jgi:uncharacterized LabA/DUF88 family protein
VIVYIDGFNLYFGLRAKHERKYHWLDIQALSQRLLLPGQSLVEVKYFSARVRNDPPAERRQATYIDALRAQCDRVTVIEGRFQEKQNNCRQCGAQWVTYEEKETDVSIAVALVEDAAADRFDTAIIVSGDSDLGPGFRAAKRIRPLARFVSAFPPRRSSAELARTADASFVISDAKIRQSLMPNTVMDAAGTTLSRPAKWR